MKRVSLENFNPSFDMLMENPPDGIPAFPSISPSITTGGGGNSPISSENVSTYASSEELLLVNTGGLSEIYSFEDLKQNILSSL